MKKRTSFLFIQTAVFLLLLTACNINVANTELLQKPDISMSNSQVTLMIPKINTLTLYINIYRQDVSDKTTPGDVTNIGLLYPAAYKADNQTFDFIDNLVTENKSYIYRVRYVDPDGVYYSNWSNIVKIDENFTSAYSEEKKLYYTTTSNTRFSYDATNYSLLLNHPLIKPEIDTFSEYQPMIIVNNGYGSQVFKISPDALSEKKEPITLKDKLPDSFLDINIKIEGVLAQKIEYVDPEADEDKLEIKTVHWTSPTSLTIKGYTDNTINIPSSHANTGLDYTRRAK